MDENIFFSIIVPTYNRAHLIGKTLVSLQQLNYSHFEIIVVDDGSTDNTEAVVTPLLDGKTVYLRKNNAERAAARNYGAQRAKGEYVNFFDSDDIAYSNHLTEAAELIQKRNKPEFFHLAYERSEPGGRLVPMANHFEGETINHKMLLGNPFGCNGVFVRRDIFLTHLFNEKRELSGSEDYELWTRLAARYPLYYSNTITSVLIEHDERSVINVNQKDLVARINCLLNCLENDEAVMLKYGKDFDQIRMECYSYVSLHLAATPGNKLVGFSYLLKAIGSSAALFGRRRFYAIIKILLLKW